MYAQHHQDKYGYLTMLGLYNLVKKDLNERYAKLGGKRKIGPRQIKFTKIVYRYLYYVFTDSMESLLGIEWFRRFGKIMVIRSKCTKYIPKKKVYENGKVVMKPIDLSATNGYFTHFTWTLPKKEKYIKRINRYRIWVSKEWKIRLIKKVFEEKKEYLYFSPGARRRNYISEKARRMRRMRHEDGKQRIAV